jgi:hypothetical protein
MRFLIDASGDIAFPADSLRRDIGELRVPPGPQAIIDGATSESIAVAAEALDLAELRDIEGRQLFVRHSTCLDLQYDLSGDPTLRLSMAREPLTGGSDDIEFRNAIITDWVTTSDYSATDPNSELCEFQWDGERHFMLTFLSFMVILRATEVRFTRE